MKAVSPPEIVQVLVDAEFKMDGGSFRVIGRVVRNQPVEPKYGWSRIPSEPEFLITGKGRFDAARSNQCAEREFEIALSKEELAACVTGLSGAAVFFGDSKWMGPLRSRSKIIVCLHPQIALALNFSGAEVRRAEWQFFSDDDRQAVVVDIDGSRFAEVRDALACCQVIA
jgi:hypothetical protein